ncbi:MAG: exopolysaccharide biosynthesis protein, partial [Burkholderiaceae bacterium]|nr:exopolysaccharide biosynthesis protein [Burkholderiaceae bacterium]
FLPIPLGNVLPALAIVLLGLGLALGDGLAVIAGWVVAAAAVTYTVAVCAGAWIWLIAPLGVWLR